METTANTATKTPSDYLRLMAEQEQRGAQAVYEDLKRNIANFDSEVNEYMATYIAQQAVALLKAAERAHTLRITATQMEGI